MQDTVAEMAKDIKAKRTGDTSASAAELYAFVNRVRYAPALLLWLQQGVTWPHEPWHVFCQCSGMLQI